MTLKTGDLTPDDFPLLYKWAVKLSTEQYEDDIYLKPRIFNTILRRVKSGGGNLIAVVGLQGVGKSAMRNQLYEQTKGESKLDSFKVRWGGEDGFYGDILQALDMRGMRNEYLRIILEVLQESIGADGKTRDRCVELVEKAFPKFRGRGDTSDIAHLMTGGYTDKEKNSELEYRVRMLIPVIEKKLGKQGMDRVKEYFFKEYVLEEFTFLIDFPDYDKRNRSEMIRDLKLFQTFWMEKAKDPNLSAYDLNANFIIFFQKELWGGHFSLGKFELFEIDPFEPEEMIEVVEKNLGIMPFSKDSILYIAKLSRGIFRRFKRYIGRCLDEFYDTERVDEISVDDARRWITLKMLIEDWDRELIDVFPRSRGSRQKAVGVLNYIMMIGDVEQSDIVTKFFGDEDSDKVKASRMLSALEEYGYLTREREGKRKIVRMGGVNG